MGYHRYPHYPGAPLAGLSGVNYSSRFALAARYTLTATGKVELLASVPWRAKYVLDDDVIRYISIENFKHEQYIDPEAPTGGVSILAHTSVPYGLQHMDLVRALAPGRAPGAASADAEFQHRKEVVAEILESVTQPAALPMLKGHQPSEVHLLGWEESQVSRSYYAGEAAPSGTSNARGALSATQCSLAYSGVNDLQPPALAFHVDPVSGICTEVGHPVADSGKGASLDTWPLLVLAGDYFTESNFDGCLRSARYAAQVIIAHALSKD